VFRPAFACCSTLPRIWLVS